MLRTKRNDVLSLAGLLVAALVLVAGPTEGRRETSQASQRAALDAASAVIAAGPGAEPDAVRTRFERLTEHELKGLYRRCSEEAVTSRLATSEIALCAVAYDVLLKQHFDGEFEALLAWSRGS